MIIIMPLHGAVGGFVFKLAVGDTSTDVIMAKSPKAFATMSLITSPS